MPAPCAGSLSRQVLYVRFSVWIPASAACVSDDWRLNQKLTATSVCLAGFDSQDRSVAGIGVVSGSDHHLPCQILAFGPSNGLSFERGIPREMGRPALPISYSTDRPRDMRMSHCCQRNSVLRKCTFFSFVLLFPSSRSLRLPLRPVPRFVSATLHGQPISPYGENPAK